MSNNVKYIRYLHLLGVDTQADLGYIVKRFQSNEVFYILAPVIVVTLSEKRILIISVQRVQKYEVADAIVRDRHAFLVADDVERANEGKAGVAAEHCKQVPKKKMFYALQI